MLDFRSISTAPYHKFIDAYERHPVNRRPDCYPDGDAMADYTMPLVRSSKSGRWETAHDVLPDDMNQLTHALRYQANKLDLDITITTDPRNRTVSFLCMERV